MNRYDKFLIDHFLQPEYANYSIKFVGLNEKDGSYKEMIKTEGNKKQYQNNAKRYIRKSLEALEKYGEVENRNTQSWGMVKIDEMVNKLLDDLKNNDEKAAFEKLEDIFEELAENARKKFIE